MMQRSLFRQSRSLASCLSSSAQPSLARPQLRAAAIKFAPAARPALASRWYSSEPEKKEGEEKKDAEPTVDPLKKELEAKDKEIIDLKVCCDEILIAMIIG